MTAVHRREGSAFGLALAALALVTGCGTPGAPMPPSLKLPDPVTDLAATRTGDEVALTWTAPKKSTDKLLLKGNVPVRICREEGTGSCVLVSTLPLAPGSTGSFTEVLPPPLAAGTPRALSYFLELNNRNGRSAGLSNAAVILAGHAPAAVVGLAATARREGVVLNWTPESESNAVRLRRKLLTPQPETKPKAQQGPLAPPPEPVEENLLVESGEQTTRVLGRSLDGALDRDIRFGQVYEYRAQRVARVTVNGEKLELDGELSAPVRIEVPDIFPPDTPTGLAAVATPGEAGAETSIDLSWQPVTNADLAGYAVYRHEDSAGERVWRRVSPAEPLAGPAFHDTNVHPGRTYRYSVSAIGRNGHESDRSAETEETVPSP